MDPNDLVDQVMRTAKQTGEEIVGDDCMMNNYRNFFKPDKYDDTPHAENLTQFMHKDVVKMYGAINLNHGVKIYLLKEILNNHQYYDKGVPFDLVRTIRRLIDSMERFEKEVDAWARSNTLRNFKNQ